MTTAVATKYQTLAAALEAEGMTQVELARRVGVSGAQINRIVKGRRVPSLSLAVRIAKVLPVDVEALAMRLPGSTDGK